MVRAAMLRLLDILGSAAGLVLLAVPGAAIALAILISDGAPVFFRQIRVGRHGRKFAILKFRTMRASGERSPITAAGDTRVTGLGGWLRKFKLDELPQLWNVFLGDMSLIGPRPEVPAFVDPEDAAWREVLKVRPGITDLASLVYRDEENVLGSRPDPVTYYRTSVLPHKLELNRRYMQARSWSTDFRLLRLTLFYSLFPKNFDPHSIQKSFFARG